MTHAHKALTANLSRAQTFYQIVHEGKALSMRRPRAEKFIAFVEALGKAHESVAPTV